MSIIIEKKTPNNLQQKIKVISWNLDINKKNTQRKISELIEKNPDIIMLQECTERISEKFTNYISYSSTSSHKGLIKLLIHKRIGSQLVNLFKDNGILIYHLDTKFGQIIVASIHLPPFNKINDKILRTITIYKIVNFIKKENLINFPIIIGGDTNMQDDEHIGNLSEDILEDLYDNFGCENNYHTWPTRIQQLNGKLINKFRFDRFFYSNLTVKNFKTWMSNNSNHCMIETDICFNKTSKDSINLKLEKLQNKNKKTFLNDYLTNSFNSFYLLKNTDN
jgi:endonuclease/exonuclease/phosphatase (EEP) superfamily protein YafD